MFYPCRYAAWLISWYIYQLLSIHHLLKLDVSYKPSSPTKIIYYGSVSTETSTYNFTFLYDGLCRKIQLGNFLQNSRFLANPHYQHNNSCNSGPIPVEKIYLGFYIFSLQNCKRKIYDKFSGSRNLVSKNSIWPKKRKLSGNEKIVVVSVSSRRLQKIWFTLDISKSYHNNKALRAHVGLTDKSQISLFISSDLSQNKTTLGVKFSLHLVCRNVCRVVITGLQLLVGTQVGNNLWTFLHHTAFILNPYYTSTYVRNFRRPRLPLQSLLFGCTYSPSGIVSFLQQSSVYLVSYSIFQHVFLYSMAHVYFFLCMESNGSGVNLTRQPTSQCLNSFVVRDPLILLTTALDEPSRLRFQEEVIQLSNERAHPAEPLFSSIVAHSPSPWKSSSVELLPHPHLIFTKTNTVSESSVELLLPPFIANITTIVRLSIFELPPSQLSTPTNIPSDRITMSHVSWQSFPGSTSRFLAISPSIQLLFVQGRALLSPPTSSVQPPVISVHYITGPTCVHTRT